MRAPRRRCSSTTSAFSRCTTSGAGPDGRTVVYNVVKIKGPEVHLDGNHALAGHAIRFAATVKAIRPATAEELAHGHVHGAHGHHH